MVISYVITPYPPELWSLENLEKFGKPVSSLEITKEQIGRISKANWQIKFDSLYVDEKHSLSFSLIDKQILSIEIADGQEFCEFILAYRSIVPADYDLYLFREGDDTSLRITQITSLQTIQHWAGFT